MQGKLYYCSDLLIVKFLEAAVTLNCFHWKVQLCLSLLSSVQFDFNDKCVLMLSRNAILPPIPVLLLLKTIPLPGCITHHSVK